MNKNVKVATSNAAETVNAAMAANVEQANEQTCCPKAKATVLAIIEGEEREITLARTIYSMETLKKGQEKMLEAVDASKLLDEIFHFATPEIFWQAGIALYDMNGDEIAEGTENVLIPVETSNTYWRFTYDSVLKHVQVHTFESVEEFAQVFSSGSSSTTLLYMCPLLLLKK